MLKNLFLLLIFSYGLNISFTTAEIREEIIKYEAVDLSMQGIIYFEDTLSSKRPGILVVHEWWGLNDYAKKRARMLAGMGYTAFAVDMYGEGKVATHPDDAKKFASTAVANFPAASERFSSALKILKNHPTVDSGKLAAIGYCFGGGLVLNLARQGIDLKGVVSFHGMLASEPPTQPGIKTKLLVCHGAEDKFIPPEQIASFKAELDRAKVDYKFISYPGAQHSFTNPDADENAKKYGLALGYNKEADQKSWQDMQKFLAELLSK